MRALPAALLATLLIPGLAIAEHGAAPAGGHHEVMCSSSDMGEAADEACAEFWEGHINWWSLDYKKGKDQKAEHRHMPPPFGFALINFAIFAAIMYRLAARPLRDYVRTRHNTIRKALEEAAALHAAAEAKLHEAEARVAGLDGEIASLVGTIGREAEAERTRLLAAAEVEAAQIRRDAESRVASELEQMRRDLRREVVAAAMDAAEKLVRQNLGPADQRRLADDFAASLERPTEAKRT